MASFCNLFLEGLSQTCPQEVKFCAVQMVMVLYGSECNHRPGWKLWPLACWFWLTYQLLPNLAMISAGLNAQQVFSCSCLPWGWLIIHSCCWLVQRRELDTQRLELLHKEFMMLTPFRTSRTAKILDVTCKYYSCGGITITTSGFCLTGILFSGYCRLGQVRQKFCYT